LFVGEVLIAGPGLKPLVGRFRLFLFGERRAAELRPKPDLLGVALEQQLQFPRRPIPEFGFRETQIVAPGRPEIF